MFIQRYYASNGSRTHAHGSGGHCSIHWAIDADSDTIICERKVNVKDIRQKPEVKSITKMLQT